VTTPDGHTLPSVLEKLYEVSKEKKYDASTGKLPPGPPGRKYAFKRQKNAPYVVLFVLSLSLRCEISLLSACSFLLFGFGFKQGH
jgi:hypothetical protein